MFELMLWADLKQKDLARLDEAADEAASRAILADALKVPADDTLRHDVLLEFYLNNLRFVRAQSMSDEKASAYFSIMKRVHEEACEALMTPQKSWEYFKALLLAHSVQRPPYSVGVFTLHDAQTLTAHALDTYFRHFKLYRYAFTMQHAKELALRNSWVEVPPSSLPPLGDMVAQEEEEAEAEAEAVEVPPPTLPPDLDVPDAVRAAVEQQLAEQVEAIRAALEGQYAARQAQHEQKLVALEAALGK